MAGKRALGTVLATLFPVSKSRSRALAAAERRAQKESARRARALEQEKKARDRAASRLRAQEKKRAQAAHVADRIEEASRQNRQIQERLESLDALLQSGLDSNPLQAVQEFFAGSDLGSPSPPPSSQHWPEPPNIAEFLEGVVEPRGLRALIPGQVRRYERALRRAKTEYSESLRRWEEQEAAAERRRLEYQTRRRHHAEAVARRRSLAARLGARYKAGDRSAIAAFSKIVLDRSVYPDWLPVVCRRTAYSPDSRLLVVELELPSADVLPATASVRYVKTRDAIEAKPRGAKELRVLYQDLLAGVALRSLSELLRADPGGYLQAICINGYVPSVDPATGRDIRPHLVSVRTTRDHFLKLDLSRVDRRVCLRNLGAQVSANPAEAQPVRPIVQMLREDKRFVAQQDVLSELDDRPNLVELSPYEFETLVANLFSKLGLESRLTRTSRDGGVDCVALDPRPVLGGKVVIQAKRYTRTVEVSAVRDLYGTMINEGASKGILVTTSGYGPTAFEFCRDKPIELIDGSGLLHLLQRIGVQARILFPAEHRRAA